MQKHNGTLSEQWEAAASRKAGRKPPSSQAAVTMERTAEPPPAAPPVKPGKTQDKLREAARGVIASWDTGDLALAVRALEAALDEKGTAMDGRRLTNLFHPASYRKEYYVTLSGEDLCRLQLLTNAPSIAGPIGLTTYVVKPKEMTWARERLRKIREGK